MKTRQPDPHTQHGAATATSTARSPSPAIQTMAPGRHTSLRERIDSSPRATTQSRAMRASFGPAPQHRQQEPWRNPVGNGPIQGRWLVDRNTGQKRDQAEPYQLQDGEQWLDDGEEHSSEASSKEESGGDKALPPVVTSLNDKIEIASSSVNEALNSVQQEDRGDVTPIRQQLPVSGMNADPGRDSIDHPEEIRIEIPDRRENRDGQAVRRHGLDIERGEARNGLELEREQDDHVEAERRKRLTLARVYSGLSAPMLDLAPLLGAAISTTWDATGLGPAFVFSAVLTVMAGLRVISEDVNKHEDSPRTWGGRIAHSCGALVPSLMTIPIGVAGTKWGADRMNVPLAVWLPFTIGLIAILIVHLIKLGKWFSR